MPRGVAAGLCLFLAMTGCAGGRVYDNGINHVYLCAVRVVRDGGYQVRQQEFRKRSGKMVAARSIPDPKETLIRRGFFSRVSEVISNTIEHSKLEFWDRDLAAARVRTDKRVVVKFKARRGFLGLGSRNRTKVKLAIDNTDYGREDWVIKRERIRAGGREELYQALAHCLEGEKGPVIIAAVGEPDAKSAAAAPKTAPSATPSADKPAAERGKPAPKQRPSKTKAIIERPQATPKQAPSAPPSAAQPKAPVQAAPEPPELEPSQEKAPVKRAEPAPKQAAPAEVTALASATPTAAPTAAPTAQPVAPIRLSPEELEDQLERGRKAYEAGKYEKTVELLEIAIQTDPKNPEALGYLGAANYQLGRYAQAILMYERYLEIVPGDLRTEDFLKEIRKSQQEKEQAQ